MKNKQNALNGSGLSGGRSMLIKLKNMKKAIYALILPLVVAGGLVFANREIKNETSKKTVPRPLSAAEIKAERERWAATPEGIKYKNWETSPDGKKVLAGAAKIRKNTSAFTDMEAVVTSLSLPPGSRLGFGMMVRINDDDYILSFGPEKFDKNFLNFNSEFRQLHNLKVNDRIIIRSHSVSWAPKYSYPIVAGDYVEQDGKIIYKRPPHKGGC
ncbi:hypothetical protein [Chitinophaga terrae (ex Kim and Jung 2007)]|nr:hypothetical protein [Chitinophaga terrae (ex Kim and Jung 2007)]